MVDETRVLRLLRSLADDVGVLEAEATATADRRADPMWTGGIRYHFVTAIESAVDVAQHICAAEGWGPPATNSEAMAILGTKSVLSAQLSTSMRQAVGFRNVLVHDYLDIDDDIVMRRLADLSDLHDFGAAVAGWLSAQRP